MLTAELAGDDQRGLAFADAALAELDSVTAPVRVAFMLGKRSVFKRLLGRPGGGDDLRAALALVPAEATVAAATRAEILLAIARFGVTPTERAYAEEALALARRSGAVGTEVNAMLTLAIGATAPAFQAAPGSEALALIAQAHASAARTGHFQAALRAATLESYLLEAAGEYERSAEVARQGMREAEENGLTRALGTFLAINVAEPLFALGRWDESLEVAERALELSPPALYQSALRARLAFVTVARGQVEATAEALSAARQVLAGAPFDFQYHLPLAELTVQLRMVADGPAAALDEALEVTERHDLSRAVPQHGWPLVIALAHVSLAALRACRRRPGGEHGRAGRHADGTAADRGSGAARRTGPLQRAYRLTFAAQVSTASFVHAQIVPAAEAPEPATARAAWDEAAKDWEALRQPYELAIALTFAAEAELADPGGLTGQDREAAGERLRRAAALAAQLGARPLADAITSLARRAGVALDAKTTARPGRLGLTDRELEVLRLVAAGRTNRDIAADLFISAKTASVHVSNILAKLGAANRAQAAAIAQSQGLFGP